MKALVESFMSRQPVAYVLFGAGAMVAVVMEMLEVPALTFALGMYLPLELNTPALVGGRGCAGCHAPHSGAAGGGGNAATNGAAFNDPLSGSNALFADTTKATTLPPQTQTNIGDLLTAAGVTPPSASRQRKLARSRPWKPSAASCRCRRACSRARSSWSASGARARASEPARCSASFRSSASS